MSDEDELGEWLRGEEERLEQEQAQRLEEKGLEPYIKFEEGETVLTLERKMPKQDLPKGEYDTDRNGFYVLEGKDEKIWGVNKNSPTYREVVALLKQAPVKIRVIRAGTGKATRYSIKKAKA
jgi:hypothetical protein